MLSRVLPHCSQMLSEFETLVSACLSQERIVWSDERIVKFSQAQAHLIKNQSIALHRADDKLWIVIDGSVTKKGLGATLYISRDEKFIVMFLVLSLGNIR